MPRVVITGPTGWIGSAMLAFLATRLGAGWQDRVTLFASTARRHRAADGSVLALRALDTIRPEDVDGAIVVHLAYLTKEKAELLGETAFTQTNDAIDGHLLHALKEGRPRGVFVASSGAAQLAERGDRHPYGLAKIRQEERFLAWGAAAGVPVLAGRIFNLAGPHINKIESYAISSFLAQAHRDGMIRIAATVPVFRSYLHVGDLCGLVVGALERGVGRPGPVDLCGAEVLEMADVAQAVAARVGGAVPILRGPIDLQRPSVYLGDFVQTRVLALEIERALTVFYHQVADTDAWMTGGLSESPDAASVP